MKELSFFDQKKIFALYFGAKYECDGNETHTVGFNNDLDNHILFNNAKLLLRPLESLTESEILELCKYTDETEYGNFRFSKWNIVKDSPWDEHYKTLIIFNKRADSFFTVDLIDGEVSLYEGQYREGPWQKEWESAPTYPKFIQWYLDHQFAIPFFPWNKNAIQLGLAKEIHSEESVFKNEK